MAILSLRLLFLHMTWPGFKNLEHKSFTYVRTFVHRLISKESTFIVRFYRKTQNDIERKPHSFFRDFTICLVRFPFNIPILSIGKFHVQLSFTCVKLTIETLEKGVTYVQELGIKTPERRQWQNDDTATTFGPFSSMSIGGFEQVNLGLLGVSLMRIVAFPANIYLSKVNNKNTRKRCEICSKLTIKIPGAFIVNFDKNISCFYC